MFVGPTVSVSHSSLGDDLKPVGKNNKVSPKGPSVVGPTTSKKSVFSDITNTLGSQSATVKGNRVGPTPGPSKLGKDNMAKGIKRINEKVTAVEVVELMDFQTKNRTVNSTYA